MMYLTWFFYLLYIFMYTQGGFISVPRDRNFLKLRANVEKQVCLTINQVVSGTQQRILQLERCFGVLVCPGRNVKQSDMQLLDMVSYISLYLMYFRILFL